MIVHGGASVVMNGSSIFTKLPLRNLDGRVRGACATLLAMGREGIFDGTSDVRRKSGRLRGLLWPVQKFVSGWNIAAFCVELDLQLTTYFYYKDESTDRMMI
jgi:hypothetical protein